MAKLGIPGHKYKTRLGLRTLIARDVEAVERALICVDKNLAVLKGGGTVMIRPELAACLADWHDEMIKVAKARAKAEGIPYSRGIIIASSAYRPLGETAAAGTPFMDECGALDSHDELGHWSGWAIDVPTRFTRESFSPILTTEECWAAAARAGLVRPFKSEYWHWRPKAAIIGG